MKIHEHIMSFFWLRNKKQQNPIKRVIVEQYKLWSFIQKIYPETGAGKWNLKIVDAIHIRLEEEVGNHESI